MEKSFLEKKLRENMCVFPGGFTYFPVNLYVISTLTVGGPNLDFRLKLLEKCVTASSKFEIALPLNILL